ncbi:partial arginyl-tRNA synthetase, partial [biofilm metagenome]
MDNAQLKLTPSPSPRLMKKKLEALLQQAVTTLKNEGIIAEEQDVNIIVEHSRDALHGDFATNLAMMLAKSAKMNPRALAKKLIAALPLDNIVTKVEIAGPGFINFFMDANEQFDIVKLIHEQGSDFGHSQVGAGKKIQVEFVSANPTGPLHVGHGRGAAYGSVVADLLAAVGFEVQREYYVNDAGRQMDILATSIWLRYLEECGEPVRFPENGYRGVYVKDIARGIYHNINNDYRRPFDLVLENIPVDESQGGDKEAHIDALITRTKSLLGNQAYADVFQAGLTSILDDIRDDLHEFGVDYQHWFSEQRLMDDGSVEKALAMLLSSGHLYEKDGAIWFASSSLGDEKDRVVKRENGQYTYFASDIAYHMQK